MPVITFGLLVLPQSKRRSAEITVHLPAVEEQMLQMSFYYEYKDIIASSLNLAAPRGPKCWGRRSILFGEGVGFRPLQRFSQPLRRIVPT